MQPGIILCIVTLCTSFGIHFCQVCQSGVADVVFVVDDSTSIQRSNYGFILSFVAGIVQGLTVGPGAVQVSFVSFSNTVLNQFWLNELTDSASVVKKIESVRFRGGGTDIKKALDYAYANNFATANGARNNVEKVLVLVTDGQSAGAEATAEALRTAGIKILCVGITSAVDLTLLQTLAGTASLVFYADTFDSLAGIQIQITSATCQATKVKPPSPCDSKPCLNNGSCIANNTDFTCQCPVTRTGRTCELDVDECKENKYNCSQTFVCVNLDGGYECKCGPGFVLSSNSSSCKEISEDISSTCNDPQKAVIGGLSGGLAITFVAAMAAVGAFLVYFLRGQRKKSQDAELYTRLRTQLASNIESDYAKIQETVVT